MTATDPCVHCDRLTATVEAAHERTLAALTSPDAGPFDAVVWLAAHLAAMEHVVEPLLDRHLLRTTEQRQEDQRLTRALQVVLRRLEQVAAGDVHAPRGAADLLRSQLLTLLADHASTEYVPVEELARILGPDGTEAVAARYDHAMVHGPTRPHPHAPHGVVVVERIAFAVDRVRDRVLDVLDARHVPIPTPRRAPRPQGRWSSYALGSMQVGERR